MTISYNWLSEYLPGPPALPEKTDPAALSKILTSIGLEVESLEKYEEIKGALEGLIIGEVMDCIKHPDADKLSITKVKISGGEELQIVCGAPNVSVGQKVVVATIGSVIYPAKGEPIAIKKAKIRGVESQGMICAEDEIGLSDNHAGILVLPAHVVAGTEAAAFFKPYKDHIFEIGLTPNRMDAMSHLGVAKDVCAYLSHHTKKDLHITSPLKGNIKADSQALKMEIVIENATDCPRYAGIAIQGVTIAESPQWLQQKLKSIGLRPINNIVDITNFILHETAQPLHAFDADKITGKKIIIKNLPESTSFVTLDEKERNLLATDLMICNAVEPMCIAGVYGGLDSGVTAHTVNIFLESAWFNPLSIRKTSLYHKLRTDAATRFEKGVDISNTVNVLKRAAILIKEIAGGEIASEITDVYPHPKSKTEVVLSYHYLKKLSGKNYHGDTIKNILTSLGFDVLKEGRDDIRVAVPFSKPDISIPADIVEEIMRIDGFDNVDIPLAISISPARETLAREAAYREKAASYLTGLGFNEIFTNSITNSVYYSEEILNSAVTMINSLSADLNVMRPGMMETGLESVAYNCNRRNTDLRLFEFGKTYKTNSPQCYEEQQHISIYITGKKHPDGWNSKGAKADFYYAKAILDNLITLLGMKIDDYSPRADDKIDNCAVGKIKGEDLAVIGSVNKKTLERFDLKQPVLFIDINWDKALELNKKVQVQFNGISKLLPVERDLSIVVDKSVQYDEIKKATHASKIGKLQSVNLFDVFESEKLGINKKAMAVSFSFLDEEKTLTDKEIDAMMGKIIAVYEKELNAEIRK